MLIPNWRDVLAHAWSIKLIIIAGILSGIEVVMPLLPTFIQIKPGYFAGGSFVVTMGAFVARITAQKSISGDKPNGNPPAAQ